MMNLKADKRDVKGKKVQGLRQKGWIPAVLYGPKASPTSLSVTKKDFETTYRQAGESSLVELEVDQDKTPVLIRGVQKHPLSGDVIHVDFYQPRLDEKIKIMVPLQLEGEAPAVKELEGTLLQNMQEVEVSALPQDLPHEITVDVTSLKTFEDRILVQDLKVNPKVEVVAEPDWIVAQVVPVENVEEELAKPTEQEAVSEVEKVGEKKEGEEGEESEAKEE